MSIRPSPIVRPARPEDLPALLRMLRAFHAASPCIDYIPFCHVSMVETAIRLSTDPKSCFLVGEVESEVHAMIAGVSSPHYVNAAHFTAHELFWWVDPEARSTRVGVRLLEAFEDWAKSIGSSTLFMASTVTLTPEKLARFYRRKGYDAVDVNYAKNLES